MTFFDLRTGNHSDGAPRLRGQEASIEEVCLFRAGANVPCFLAPISCSNSKYCPELFTP
jgi:hypothetical protein